jgi:hypothetical protein
VTQGSGTWAITGAAPGAVPQTNITAAAMVVGQVYPEHLSSITIPTAGSAILYIP